MNQTELLLRIKRHFKSSIKNANDQDFYLSSFSPTPGWIILKKLQNKYLSFFAEKKINFYLFLSSLSLSNTKIFYKKISGKFNSIILTWGNIRNFKKNGSFEDKYFKQKSKKNKKFL